MTARTGAQFRESLRDARTVFVNGERVADVTTYPPFRGIVETLSDLYDLQHSRGEDLTFPSPKDGTPTSLSFLQATSVEEVTRRVRAERIRAEHTFGLLGRLPDFCNAQMTDLTLMLQVFEAGGKEHADNMVRFYEHCRDGDLCVTHTLVDPQVDRSKGPAQQDDPFIALRVVEETAEGLILRGARMLSTLAPFANEIFVGPYYPRKPEEDPYSLCFAVPVGTPGLKFLCRETYDTGRSRFDRPLTSRFDEEDALAIFDDVLVPHDRVFIKANAGLCNYLIAMPPLFSLLQTVTRSLAKLKFMTGLASMLAEVVGRSENPHTKVDLGELVANVWTVEGLIRAGIHEVSEIRAAQPGAPGAPRALIAAHGVVIPRLHIRAVEVIRMLSGSGLIMTPTEKDFANPEIAPFLDKFLRGKGTPARRRVELFKLAWDMVGDQFGSRQLHYELFYAGEPMHVRARFFNDMTVEPYRKLTTRLLEGQLGDKK